MITRKLALRVLCCLPTFTFPALSHMQMSWPYPLHSEFNPANTYEDIDYSMTDPLNADGSNFPCKGYQNDRPIQPVVTYKAGSSYNMTLAGSAMHGGGSCQLSLSYDNGATFRVIQSMIGGCPLTTTYDFTVPSSAPTGTALFAWTWQNLIGNREFYMNCAEVNVVGVNEKKHRRRQTSTFDQLPYIWKANLEGLNTCVTQENVSVVYPHPGPRVLYGGGLSSTSPATPGDCNNPTPYGQTYNDLDDLSSPPAPAAQPTSNTVTAGAVSTPPAADQSQPAKTYSSTTPIPLTARKFLNNPEQYSTITITVGCEPTLTLSTMPSYYITAAACTGTSAACPCANGYACLELSPCIWGCEGSATPPPTSSTPATRFVTTTQIVSPVQSTPPPSPSPPSNAGAPQYVGANANSYLPCVPGTFICIDSQTWDTCDYNAQGQWVYEYPRTAAAGTMCQPNLSVSSGDSQDAQQALTPQGYYRNDQIVRA